MTDTILFFDVDGPMIPQRAWRLMPRTGMIVRKFDPVAVAHVRSILDRSKGKIVVTSVVAKLGSKHCKELFEENGLPWGYVHDDWKSVEPYPPRSSQIPHNGRAEGIQDWLKDHPEVKRYAVLDDEDVVIPNLVQVTLADGLLTAHIDHLENLLCPRELPDQPQEEPKDPLKMTYEERAAFVREAWQRAKAAPMQPELVRWMKAASTITQEDLNRIVR